MTYYLSTLGNYIKPAIGTFTGNVIDRAKNTFTCQNFLWASERAYVASQTTYEVARNALKTFERASAVVPDPIMREVKNFTYSLLSPTFQPESSPDYPTKASDQPVNSPTGDFEVTGFESYVTVGNGLKLARVFSEITDTVIGCDTSKTIKNGIGAVEEAYNQPKENSDMQLTRKVVAKCIPDEGIPIVEKIYHASDFAKEVQDNFNTKQKKEKVQNSLVSTAAQTLVETMLTSVVKLAPLVENGLQNVNAEIKKYPAQDKNFGKFLENTSTQIANVENIVEKVHDFASATKEALHSETDFPENTFKKLKSKIKEIVISFFLALSKKVLWLPSFLTPSNLADILARFDAKQDARNK